MEHVHTTTSHLLLLTILPCIVTGHLKNAPWKWC